MVHALSEIHRVLIPNGILIDLRPILDHWQIEVASAREVQITGRMQDFQRGLEDDAAANQAMREAETNGGFEREREEFFPLIYSWDSPSEMDEWIKEEWDGFIDLDEATNRATRSAWAVGDGDSRVRVKAKMLITRWKKS